jgi:hypothetical protein
MGNDCFISLVSHTWYEGVRTDDDILLSAPQPLSTFPSPLGGILGIKDTFLTSIFG